VSDELGVDPQVLVQAAQGITAITGSLEGLGIGETAVVGRGFSLLSLSPMEAGKPEVQSALEEFAERWSWGVRSLVQSANEIARVLELDAGMYHEMEQMVSDTFKTMWTHVAGNPHLSGEEIAERSWEDTLADNPVNHVLNPDYSAESFAEAAQTIRNNNEVIEQVAPQAFANVSPQLAGALGVDAERGWNTGAAGLAAEMTAGGGGTGELAQ
jgi:hypothetical protein